LLHKKDFKKMQVGPFFQLPAASERELGIVIERRR
jgi:hypothetical protein